MCADFQPRAYGTNLLLKMKDFRSMTQRKDGRASKTASMHLAMAAVCLSMAACGGSGSNGNGSSTAVVTPAAGYHLLAGDLGGTGTLDGVGAEARYPAGSLGIVSDTAGNVYSIEGTVIRKTSPAGAVSVYAGQREDGRIVDGPLANARFASLKAIAIDSSGNLYVADESSVRKITTSGMVSTLATVDWGLRGMVADHAGNLFGTTLFQVIKIAADGTVVAVAGSANTFGTADGSGTAASFHFPRGITIDAAGILYVSDTENNLIRKVTPSGDVTTIAGSGPEPDSKSVDGVGSAAHFYRPTGITIGKDDALYVVDEDNYTVRRVTKAGEVTTFAGKARTPGWVDATGLVPTAIAANANGDLLVSDGLGTMRKITPAGVVTTLAGQTRGAALSQTVDLLGFNFVGDGSGNLYTTNGTSISKLTAAGEISLLAGASGQPGYSDGRGSSASFSGLRLAPGGKGALYGIDDHNMIRKIASDGTVSTLPNAVADQSVPTTSACNAKSQEVDPIADGAGTVYVAVRDFCFTFNDVTSIRTLISQSVRRVAADGTVTTLAGADALLARDGYTGKMIAAGSNGNLYGIVQNTIVKYAGDGKVTTLAGTSGSGYQANVIGGVDGVGSAARFNNPSGLIVDADENVYVIDSGTVRKVAPNGSVSTIAGKAGDTAVDFDGQYRIDSLPGILSGGVPHMVMSDAKSLILRTHRALIKLVLPQ